MIPLPTCALRGLIAMLTGEAIRLTWRDEPRNDKRRRSDRRNDARRLSQVDRSKRSDGASDNASSTASVNQGRERLLHATGDVAGDDEDANFGRGTCETTTGLAASPKLP